MKYFLISLGLGVCAIVATIFVWFLLQETLSEQHQTTFEVDAKLDSMLPASN